MEHVFTHDSDFETAKRAVDLAWEHYKEQLSKYKPELEWADDSLAKIKFSVGRILFRFEIVVGKDAYDISANVPPLFRMFKKRAVLLLEDEIRKWSSKAANSR